MCNMLYMCDGYLGLNHVKCAYRPHRPYANIYTYIYIYLRIKDIHPYIPTYMHTIYTYFINLHVLKTNLSFIYYNNCSILLYYHRMHRQSMNPPSGTLIRDGIFGTGFVSVSLNTIPLLQTNTSEPSVST